MIYYYSATGNTRYAADYLGKLLNEKTENILDCKSTPDLSEEKMIGIMFPIYCWGIPPTVSEFIEKIQAEISEDCYLWSVCTCGDEAGTAMRQLKRRFAKTRGRGLDLTASLIMPNTYVLLPGFDVDKPEIEQQKLEAAPKRLDEIAEKIKNRLTGIYDVSEGSAPALRSMLFPLFDKWGIYPSHWKVSEKCIGCGKCEKICPAKNILLRDSHPVWGKNCNSCCACFHVCPVKAISYGNITRNKSQYICPLK